MLEGEASCVACIGLFGACHASFEKLQDMRLTVSMALQADHTFFAGSETHKKSMPGVIWEDVVATKHPPFSDRMQLREPYRAALMCVGFIVKPNGAVQRRPSTARTSDGTACWAPSLRLAKNARACTAVLSEDKLPLPLDHLVVLFEAVIPGLMFIRAQNPKPVPDDLIVVIFEWLARR
jgi:hypothetical protein